MIFSLYIVGYLFLAGLASGSFIISSACSIYDAVKQSRESEELAIASQGGFLIAPVVIILAAFFLILDIGSPEKAWLIVLSPFESIISTGAWLVTLFAILSIAVAIRGFSGKTISPIFLWLAWIIGSLLAIGVMTYTGLLLSDIVAIDFWHTWLLPLLFIVSSLATGLAAILIYAAISGKGPKDSYRQLWAVSGLFSVTEIVVIAAFLLNRYQFSEVARESCEMLLFGGLAPVFWIGIVACGLVVPLLLHILDSKIKNVALPMSGSVGVLAGGAIVRFCIVAGAAYSPLVISTLL